MVQMSCVQTMRFSKRSKDGLGICLLQQDQPITYAGRMMTPAEHSYAQIENRTSAFVSEPACFHQYAYGRSNLIQFDHRPMEAIMKNPLSRLHLHLQHML